MAGSGRTRRAAQEFRFEARCAWCGPVAVAHEGLHVFVSPRGASLFEFRCPSCARMNFRSLSISDLEALALAGILPAQGRAPFELLEERSGPPIAWDDLIDFHHEIDEALERDAA
jgi:hypothetical protein